MAKVVTYLREHELTAHDNPTQRAYRATKAQATLIIRRELERPGMIEVVPTNRGRTTIRKLINASGKTS